MTTTYFLATVLGWYLVITALLLLLKRDWITSVMNDIMAQPAVFFVIAAMTLILGLLMVVSHNIWVMKWPVVVTIIAWIALISGLLRMFCPDTVHHLWTKMVARPSSLITSAIVILILGLYLLFKVYAGHIV